MAKIWKDRIEAGTQLYRNCPIRYKEEVKSLIKEDIENMAFTLEQLQELVESGKLTVDEYNEIIG